jgi:hypothetical protein
MTVSSLPHYSSPRSLSIGYNESLSLLHDMELTLPQEKGMDD